MSEDRLNEVEAAQILGVAVNTLQAWRYRKQGPKYVKLGALVRYRRRDLDSFVEGSVVDPNETRPRRGRKAA